MCPACLASVGIVVGSVVSTGGLTALVIKVFHMTKIKSGDFMNKEQQS
jgi:hypothetical protein